MKLEPHLPLLIPPLPKFHLARVVPLPKKLKKEWNFLITKKNIKNFQQEKGNSWIGVSVSEKSYGSRDLFPLRKKKWIQKYLIQNFHFECLERGVSPPDSLSSIPHSVFKGFEMKKKNSNAENFQVFPSEKASCLENPQDSSRSTSPHRPPSLVVSRERSFPGPKWTEGESRAIKELGITERKKNKKGGFEMKTLQRTTEKVNVVFILKGKEKWIWMSRWVGESGHFPRLKTV